MRSVNRLRDFDAVLGGGSGGEEGVSLPQLRALAFGGIPDERLSLRALVWKLMLGYLPVHVGLWETVREQRRGVYKELLKEFIVSPYEAAQRERTASSAAEDHPLSLDASSTWRAIFQDNEAFLEQIDKDVRRTLPDIAFFQTKTHFPHPLTREDGSYVELFSLKNRVERTTLKASSSSLSRDERPGGRPAAGAGGAPATSVDEKTGDGRKKTKAKKNRAQSAKNASLFGDDDEEDTDGLFGSWDGIKAHPLSATLSQPVSEEASGDEEDEEEEEVVEEEDDDDNDDEGEQRPRKDTLVHETEPTTATSTPAPASAPTTTSASASESGSCAAEAKSDSSGEEHWEVLERILFLYAKLNPGVRYIQGMNELLAPLYFVFANDPSPEWRMQCEADAFFCFTMLMGEVRDNFIKALDVDEHVGISAQMNRIMKIIHLADEPLWHDLIDKGIKPHFFAFRWVTLMLSQEFHLPDVIRMWDSLISDPDRYDFLLYLCAAMVILVRDDIINGDFAMTVKLLQSYPDTDIHILLDKASSVMELVCGVSLATNCEREIEALHCRLFPESVAPIVDKKNKVEAPRARVGGGGAYVPVAVEEERKEREGETSTKSGRTSASSEAEVATDTGDVGTSASSSSSSLSKNPLASVTRRIPSLKWGRKEKKERRASPVQTNAMLTSTDADSVDTEKPAAAPAPSITDIPKINPLFDTSYDEYEDEDEDEQAKKGKDDEAAADEQTKIVQEGND